MEHRPYATINYINQDDRTGEQFKTSVTISLTFAADNVFAFTATAPGWDYRAATIMELSKELDVIFHEEIMRLSRNKDFYDSTLQRRAAAVLKEASAAFVRSGNYVGEFNL